MKYSFEVKISEHIWEDTLGQLICLDAIIAREGYQEYYEDDILNNGSFKVVKVMRPWDEVKKSASTFEAKPIVIQHPSVEIEITVKNIKEYKVGHVQNVRESEHDGIKVLIADLVFDDEKAIKLVKSGELRELSCGYFYEIDTKDMKQYDIRGEHLALVEEGRAGIAKIIDSKEEIFELNKYLKLATKEEKEKFMSKISTESLNGIKDYYNKNEGEIFSPEEIEMVIKIIDRELNNRNNVNMGLSEEAKKDNIERNNKIGDTEKLEGGLGDNATIRKLAFKHDVTEKYIRRELQKGIRVESEHTDDHEIAKEIAMDHLTEDAEYYEKLAKMESEKAQDLYIEDDDKISLNFEEDEVAWVSSLVSSIFDGDIISELRSTRPYEVQSQKESDDEVTLYLISTDSNHRKTLRLSKNSVIDILVLLETGERIRFENFKDKVNDKKFFGKKEECSNCKTHLKGIYKTINGKKYCIECAENIDKEKTQEDFNEEWNKKQPEEINAEMQEYIKNLGGK